jgi:multidrug efflux system membrane fusion protein
MEPVPHAPPEPVSSPEPRPRASRRRWVVIAVAVVVLVAVLWLVRRSTSGTTPAQAGPPQGAQQPRAVPVAAAPVTRRDVPITLEGLGTVVAYRTVVVKPQVDGRMDQVLFREGQPVRAGQVLAQIDPRPFESQLHQVEGARARDAAQLAAARVNLERYRTLAKQNLIGQQQADDQAALVGQLEGTVRLDDAAIENAKLNLGFTRITSPIDGVTGIRIVDPGNVVHASDQSGIVLVTQIDPISVIFTLPQDQLPAVAEAMGAGPLAVDVLGRDGATVLGTGKLELIDNQINQATATMRLKAVLPNPRRVLWPNQFVNARLRLSTRQGALVIPGTAIQRGPSGIFVYVVGTDATVAPRPVEVAATAGDLAVIGRGLAEGDQVVVDGQNQLRPGSKVVVREAAQKGGSAAPRGAPPPAGARGEAPAR